MSDSGEIVENCIEIIRAYKKCYGGNPSIHDILGGSPKISFLLWLVCEQLFS